VIFSLLACRRSPRRKSRKDFSIPTTVVTGGAGFFASPLRSTACRGHRARRRQPRNGSLTNIEHRGRPLGSSSTISWSTWPSPSRPIACSTSPARQA
jgi:hypothetical protein